MYRRLVEHRIRQLWDAANRGDLDAILDNFAARFSYVGLAGDTPLSTECHTVDELRDHLVTVATTFPGVRYDVASVMAGGWPHHTRVMTVIDVHAPLADGTRYANQIVQYVQLRWGKVTEARGIVDVQKVHDALARQAAVPIGTTDTTDAAALTPAAT
jgi:ketosteroid isomerase-like protein